MRRDPTEAERKLWYALRDRRMQALKFRRQAPIGPYIVDFLCIAHRLVVEADGSQHAESKRDAIRDEWLAREGYAVLRFSNRDILMGARERACDDRGDVRFAVVRCALALTPTLSRKRERRRNPSPACGRRWTREAWPDEGLRP
jgi:very-short-patch-repair endonuclease